MKSKKNIITIAAIAILGTSFNAVYAETNNLIQMDVKRSSVADTVDVTFYTTLNSANSVATRKSGNRYVVLLPNTASTASVAPNFGAVKDLITNIDVKHVNDGMGGYTKVTFETTKPISIKTHMAKTAPLTQAQQDARALIAKNNIQNTEPKPAVDTTMPAQTAKPAAAVKKAEPQKTSVLPKILNIDFSKTKTTDTKPAQTNKKAENTKPAAKAEKPAKQTAKPKKETPSVQTPAPGNNYVPKMKFDSNGNRIIDLEPRVNHSVESEKPDKTTPQENKIEQPAAVPSNVNENKENTAETAAQTPVQEKEKEKQGHGFPFWILGVSGSIALLGILYLIFDAARHSADKDRSRLESFCNISAQNQVKRRKREYYDIVNNEELNWQEKYKLYNEKEDGSKPQKHIAAMSYVTDISGLKTPSGLAENTDSDLTPEQIAEKNHNRIVNKKVKAKMLELENSYSAPSARKETVKESKVRSEDDVILKNFNEIKLKSFSKPMSLKETQRTLINKDSNNSRNKSFKEGKFVKLKTAGQYNKEQKQLGTSDLINMGDKYLMKKNTRMNKEKENYLVSSLDEYMSILDTEKPDLTEMSAIKMPTSEAMIRSGVSNPISSSYARVPQNIIKPEQRVDGLIVKSGYNIDANSGFYVVSLDGVSAIVGKIKENIFVLKKFDRVIDSPIQVRRDDGNVYIVKAGKYKCLVNVEHDKMGTLIEI